uniref:Uncharacterized protein n=1 Tax=Magallana gigas TaxID=29159 RepID=K1PBD9_MAGGI
MKTVNAKKPVIEKDTLSPDSTGSRKTTVFMAKMKMTGRNMLTTRKEGRRLIFKSTDTAAALILDPRTVTFHFPLSLKSLLSSTCFLIHEFTMIEAVALYFVSEDCGQWANFLKTKLGEKAYDIRVHEIEAALALECEDSYKANIILASPAFLELPNYDHFCSISKQQSLVVLLGVEESEFEAALKEREADTILGFPIFETEANESSVRCLLVEIIDLYERNVPTEDFMHHSNVPYDLLPAPKPIPTSSYQLQKYIISERDSKLYLIMTHKDEENILVQDENRPEMCVQCKYLGNALYEASLTDDFNRSQSLRIVTTKRRNVATLQIEPKSDQSAGDKLSQIQELLHAELEPLTVLCKALRLPEVSVFCLDKFLADKCSNFKMFDPLKSLSLGDNLAEKHSEESNWPTLLHFGAELGLSLFCDELIKVPGMDKICHVTNSQDETPGQLARNRGFLKLAEKLDMLTVTQRDKHSPSGRTVDSLLEDDAYEMPPPTPHQSSQYYVNSNQAKVRHADDVFDLQTADDGEDEVAPPPPPKMKSTPAPCKPVPRPPVQSERSSIDSSSGDSRMSIDSRYSTDSRTTITSETSMESVTTLDSGKLSADSGDILSSDSSDDTTIADYVDMATTSNSYMDMRSVQRNGSKTKPTPPVVLPKPNRSSDSSVILTKEDAAESIATFDDELDSGPTGSEYMPMKEVHVPPHHLKKSHSESVVNVPKQLPIPDSEDYVNPTSVSPRISPRTSLMSPVHNVHSTSDLKQDTHGHRPSYLPFGGSHESRFHGFTSTPVPHERAMSESDTRHHGGFHQRIGSPVSPLAQGPLSEKAHHYKRSSSVPKKCVSDDDMSLNRGQGFFSKLKSKMGGKGGRKMSCPPEAIKESLDKFNQRNQQLLRPSDENRMSNASTSSSSSHSSYHEGQTHDESGAGERRKSVRIDKMKKDKNLQLLELPAKRK